MAVEFFEKRTLTGDMNVACKFDNGGVITVKYWQDKKEQVIAKVRHIVNNYIQQGYILSLRQLHYQMVIKNWIINHDTAYKKLGNILDDCRYSALVDWKAIEDRGRIPYLPYWVNNPDEALQDTIDSYRINRQDEQETYIELWTEKDALSGILRRTTSKYHVKLVVNKGYTSSSAAYAAYERISENILLGKRVIILYFGDHDPSGLDMIRDIRDRLLLFLGNGKKLQNGEGFWDKLSEWWEVCGYNLRDLVQEGFASEKIYKMFGEIEPENYDELVDECEAGKVRWYLRDHDLFKVDAIGLTMAQIKQYNLPPNPTKFTDSRAKEYVKKFGTTCWEVDALEPSVLTEIVETNILKNIDVELYKRKLQEEKEGIEYLKKLLNK